MLNFCYIDSYVDKFSLYFFNLLNLEVKKEKVFSFSFLLKYV